MHRIVYILLLVIVFVPCLLMAQPTDPSGDPDNPVPITGIELLIGAGALLGSKKLLQRKRKH